MVNTIYKSIVTYSTDYKQAFNIVFATESVPISGTGGKMQVGILSKKYNMRCQIL